MTAKTHDYVRGYGMQDTIKEEIKGCFFIIPLCSNELRILNPYRECSIHADPGPL